MALPNVAPATLALYNRLPAYLRAADAEQAEPDYPLLRYLSLLGDQLDEVVTLVDRFDYRHVYEGGEPGDTSDLVDPATADPAWLPWLAQLVGVDLADVTGVPARRELLTNTHALLAHGSDDAIRARVLPLLDGAKYLLVETHYLADPWKILIVTLYNETLVTPAELLAEAGIEKPAGVELRHTFGIAWDDLEASYPTWSAIEAAGSWHALMPIS